MLELLLKVPYFYMLRHAFNVIDLYELCLWCLFRGKRDALSCLKTCFIFVAPLCDTSNKEAEYSTQFNSIDVYVYSAFHDTNRCKAASQKI